MSCFGVMSITFFVAYCGVVMSAHGPSAHGVRIDSVIVAGRKSSMLMARIMSKMKQIVVTLGIASLLE